MQGRIASGEASSKTVKRRAGVLETVREVTSGGDSTSQLAAEVNCLTKVQVQLPLAIPVDHALAMKADLLIPWTMLRVLRKGNANNNNNKIALSYYMLLF